MAEALGSLPSSEGAGDQQGGAPPHASGCSLCPRSGCRMSNSCPGDIRTSRYGAVAFFVQRARMAKPDFRLTEENAPVVAEICVRLDGMPLAIGSRPPRTRSRRGRSSNGSGAGCACSKADHGTRRGPPEDLRDAIGWSYDLQEGRAAALRPALGLRGRLHSRSG